MSKAEILAERPLLKADERKQVLTRLCELVENDLIQDSGPSDAEKKLLDEALAEYERDRDPGIPWREALRRVRSGQR